MLVVQSQASRLQDLTSQLEARGLLDDVDLELDLDDVAGKYGTA
jgi:hypothetical protein